MNYNVLTRAQVVEIALRNDPADFQEHGPSLASDWMAMHTRLQQLEPADHERLVRFSAAAAKQLQEHPSQPVTVKVEQQPDGFLELIASIWPGASPELPQRAAPASEAERAELVEQEYLRLSSARCSDPCEHCYAAADAAIPAVAVRT